MNVQRQEAEAQANDILAMGQEMFARHAAEDQQFFQDEKMEIVDPNQNSQPVVKEQSFTPARSSGRRIKSPSKLRSAQATSPPKMATRRQQKSFIDHMKAGLSEYQDEKKK